MAIRSTLGPLLLKRAGITLLSFLLGFIAVAFLQFSGRDRIRASAGAISITGIRGANADTGANADAGAVANAAETFPDSLTIGFEGIGFTFGRNRPLAGRTGSGSSVILSPKAWSHSGRIATVTLDKGAILDFEAGPDGESFAVHARFGDAGIETLALPYSLSGASFQANLGERLSVRTKAGTYTLGLPEGSGLDTEGYVLNLAERKNAFSLALVRRPKAEPAAPRSASIPRTDDQGWRTALAAWLDTTYAGLRKGRFLPGSSAWLAGQEEYFSDRALAVLIAESLRRNGYADIRPMVATIAKARAAELGWLSSVYLGDIIAKEEAMRAGDAERERSLSARFAAKDGAILLEPELVHFCVDRSPSLLPKLLTAAANLDPEALDPSSAAGALLCLADAEDYFPGADNPFSRLESSAIRVLEAAMVPAGERAFIPLAGSEADMALQARIGTALARIGEMRGDEDLAGSGRTLSASVISFADSTGLLPATVRVSGGKATSEGGILVPEDIYPYLAENPWYPRAKSLSREAGAGTWLLSCSPLVGVEWGNSQANVSADWPVGATHYMIFFNVPPIALMRLYEIPYNPDPSFDRYNASGYLYVKSTRVLYVKMKHKANREYIRMNF